MVSQVEGHLRLPDHETKAWVAKRTLLMTLPWFPQEDPEALQLSNLQGHSDTVSLPLSPLRAHQECRTHVRREGRSKSGVS